jgi:hypothetical protein
LFKNHQLLFDGMEKEKDAADAKAILFKRYTGLNLLHLKKCCRSYKGNTMLCTKKVANRPN